MSARASHAQRGRDGGSDGGSSVRRKHSEVVGVRVDFAPSLSPEEVGCVHPWAGGPGLIFRAASQKSLGHFSPSDALTTDIRPRSACTQGPIHPPQAGEQAGRAPTHLGPHTGRVGPEEFCLSQGQDWNLGGRWELRTPAREEWRGGGEVGGCF